MAFTGDLGEAILPVRVTFEQVDKDMSAAQSNLTDKLRKVGDGMVSVGKTLTKSVTLPIIAAFGFMAKEAEEAAKAEMQLETVLKSTGGVANVTADHAKKLASSLQEVSTFGDDAIISGQNLLLTFTNIRNEAGKGNDVFDQTTALMLDLSAAMGQDMKTSAVQLGKALNDPAKGVTALTKVGVSFTEQQIEQIKTLQKNGDLLGAQKIILGELETQFGGSAEAMSKTAGGQFKQAMNALGDVAESFGAVLAPVIKSVASFAKKVAAFFDGLSPKAKQVIVTILAVAAAVGPLLIIGGKLIHAFLAISKAFGVLKAALMANPFVAIAAAVIAIAALIVANWDKIQDFLVGVWNAIKGAVVAAWNGIKSFFSGLWNTITGALKSAWNAVKDFFTGLWTKITSGVKSAWGAIVAFFAGIPGKILGFFAGAGAWLLEKGKAILRGLWNGVKEIAQTVWDWFRDLPERIAEFFKNVGKWLWQAGRDLILGFWEGIKSVWTATVKPGLQGMTDEINNVVKQGLKTSSPSRVMMQVGRDVGEGLALGIAGQTAAVRRAAGALADASMVKLAPPTMPRPTLGRLGAASDGPLANQLLRLQAPRRGEGQDGKVFNVSVHAPRSVIDEDDLIRMTRYLGVLYGG